jgi:beta-lactamase superfamily II metal-dependent hydrolase
VIKVHFKKVGQGDSILIEWVENGEKHVGIIDCNIFGVSNPTLQYLEANSIKHIDFIVLTHFHVDHFSGLAEIFKYCIEREIKVKSFYHTLDLFVLDFYDKVYSRKRIDHIVTDFFKAFEEFDDIVGDKIQISRHLQDLKITEGITLQFLSPDGSLYQVFAKQLARKRAVLRVTYPDINRFSPIMIVKSSDEGILLCGDAIQKSFKSLKEYTLPKISLAQVPHHGSRSNIYEEFWVNLDRVDNCPAVFSVGDEPKDKLPNIETVSFLDSLNYYIYSTEAVYGIADYFGLPTKLTPGARKKQRALNAFSRLVKNREEDSHNDRFNGDKIFELFT